MTELLAQVAGLRLELKNRTQCPHELVVFLRGDLFHSFSEILSELDALEINDALDTDRFGIDSHFTTRSLSIIKDVQVRELLNLKDETTDFYLQMKEMAEQYASDQIVFVALDSGAEITKIGDFS